MKIITAQLSSCFVVEFKDVLLITKYNKLLLNEVTSFSQQRFKPKPSNLTFTILKDWEDI